MEDNKYIETLKKFYSARTGVPEDDITVTITGRNIRGDRVAKVFFKNYTRVVDFEEETFMKTLYDLYVLGKAKEETPIELTDADYIKTLKRKFSISYGISPNAVSAEVVGETDNGQEKIISIKLDTQIHFNKAMAAMLYEDYFLPEKKQ